VTQEYADAFLSFAIGHGLTSAIVDARSSRLAWATRATDVLLDRDFWGANWIAAHHAQQTPAATRRAFR